MGESNRRRKAPRRRWIVLGAALLVATALVVAWFATRGTQEKAVEYDVVDVTRSTQTSTVSLSGTITPKDQSNATFTVPGTITAILVKVGDKVTQGGPLATVDTRDLSDAVALADANAAAARAQLTTVTDRVGATAAQKEAARAQVRSAEASLRSARNRLVDATLTSPLDGTVASVDYTVGDQVTGTSASLPSSSSVFSGLTGSGAVSAGSITVIATDAWKLDAAVGTADLPTLKAGQAVVVTPTGTSTRVTGIVDTVGIVASQNAGATATFPVTIAIANTAEALFSGSSADAVVTTGTYDDVLTVPVAAVTTDNGRSTVRLLSGSDAVPTEVTLGRRFGAQVEILGGINAGDRIQVAHAQVVAQATQGLYGPNGQFLSPSATPSK